MPFLLAVAFVAVHHAAMSLWMPMSVFSTPQAQMHPILFSLLHAAFLLLEATFLAYGWKFTEDADRARRAESAPGRAAALAQAQAQAELAAERAAAAEEAAAALAQREQPRRGTRGAAGRPRGRRAPAGRERRHRDHRDGRAALRHRGDRHGRELRDDHGDRGQRRVPARARRRSSGWPPP